MKLLARIAAWTLCAALAFGVAALGYAALRAAIYVTAGR